MVLYSYTVRSKDRSLLYFCKGADVTPLNFLTWRFQLSRLLQQMPAAPVPPCIPQGDEPERFVAIMEGMVVLTGMHPLTRAAPRSRQASLSAAAGAPSASGDSGGGEGAATVEGAPAGEGGEAYSQSTGVLAAEL